MGKTTEFKDRERVKVRQDEDIMKRRDGMLDKRKSKVDEHVLCYLRAVWAMELVLMLLSKLEEKKKGKEEGSAERAFILVPSFSSTEQRQSPSIRAAGL